MSDNENMVVRKLDIQDNPFTSSYLEESRRKEVLDKYEKAMENREVINVEFSLVAKNGDMYEKNYKFISLIIVCYFFIWM